MNPPPVPADCPQCRRALPPGAPLGMCPSCLMDAAGTESEIPVTADPFAAPLDLETLRRVFPQLEILAPLGAGGMGRVYKVRQPHLDRIVALKVVPPEFARDPAWVERFTREARALARLNHPNIVQVYDFGQTGDTPPLCWLLMEYVDGVTLRQVQRTGGLSSREALTLIPKLCDALQYAHEKGVLHRDIKPENILLDAGGGVKIADFGLAKLTDDQTPLTIVGANLGKIQYSAPEQRKNAAGVNKRADIYPLGIMFFEMLVGRRPQPGDRLSKLKPDLPKECDEFLDKATASNPDERFQSAKEFRDALLNLYKLWKEKQELGGETTTSKYNPLYFLKSIINSCRELLDRIRKRFSKK